MFYLTLWRNMRITVNYVIYTLVQLLMDLVLVPTPIILGVRSQEEAGLPDLLVIPIAITRDTSYVEVQHNFTRVRFVQDICDPRHVAYAAISGDHKGKIILSIDNFKKTSTRLVLHRLYADSIGRIPWLTDMEFIRNYFIAVINHQVYIYDITDPDFGAVSAQGIESSDKVTQLSVFKCCSTVIKWCVNWASTVVAYSQARLTRIFYFSFNTGSSFNRGSLNTTAEPDPGIQYWIHGAAVMSTDLVVLFMVQRPTDYKLVLIGAELNPNEIYHKMDKNWVHPYYELLTQLQATASSVANKELGLAYIRSNFDSLIIWDTKVIIYKARFRQKPTEIVLHQPTGDNSGTLFQSGETVRYVDSNRFGQIVIITSTNRILYSQEALNIQAVYVSGLTSLVHDDTVIRFSTRGDFELVGPHTHYQIEDSSILYISSISLDDLLKEMDNFLPQCPYKAIVSQDLEAFYEIDITDGLKFNLVIFPDEWHDSNLITELSVPNTLYIDSQSVSLAHLDDGLLTSTFSLKKTLSVMVPEGIIIDHSLQERLSSTEKTRVTALRILAPETSISCTYKPQIVTHIGLGCAPDRYISARREPRNCDRLRHEQSSYILSQSEYQVDFGLSPTPSQDKTVIYNYHKYGCPNRTYYNSPFTFDIHLYQGDDYIGPVTGRYVIYEVNGVNKFKYSKKIADVNCSFHPQTWREMAMLARLKNIQNKSYIWHRGNYIGCDDENGATLLEAVRGGDDQPSLEDDYEILGSDTGNDITFERNGIFLFEIIVIDHKFSFCDLRTYLAVEVYGYPPRVPIPYFIIMSAAIIAFLILVVVCFCFRASRIRRELHLLKQMDEVDDLEVAMASTPGMLYSLSDKRTSAGSVKSTVHRRFTLAPTVLSTSSQSGRGLSQTNKHNIT